MDFDHIVVGAENLEAGRDYVRDILGVDVPPGGCHERFSTHNRLMKLGGRTYFEIIAIDPDQPTPGRPRWFSLDDPAMRVRLAERPGLIAWVARSPDLAATVAASVVDLGTVIDMQRGDLRWRMAIPDDGVLREEGCMPMCIQWPDGIHPADALPDLGVRLDRLVLHHPDPNRLCAQLSVMGAADLVEVAESEAPGLVAYMARPDGGAVVLD